MNRLKNEKSDYLLQHADNPVDWFAWSDEAFEKAEKENKPIMLSIGYSACHWCHVMAHESFEDPETADIMNREFVNIKLDKEERPDLDKIYQMSQTIITGKTGGWPLTVFMTPSKYPFFAGTYFPTTERYGLPSFKDILSRVSDFYKTQKEDIKQQNIQITNIFENLNKTKESKNIINDDYLLKVKSDLISSMDKVHGGFGSAPKFPHITNLEFLIKLNNNDSETLEIIELTLMRMCCGGIYDHLKGGFFRYSVDELWMIPHFEKMLYDNGPMIGILSDAYRVTKNNLFLEKMNQSCKWLIDEMQDDSGGYYSTIDADSENVEGKYYAWLDSELLDILTHEEYLLFQNIFSVYNKPNFEGKYHLHVTKTNQQLYIDNQLQTNIICDKLLEVRNDRIRPGTDKKILVSWNSLTIIGLLNAYKLEGKEKYYQSSRKCFDFIKKNMWRKNKLYACYHDEPCFDAYLDDYALLAKSCIEFLKIDWKIEDFNFLIELVDNLLDKFQDKINGGFYFTSSDHEKLIYRPKSYMDESLPSGNSICIEVLNELYELTGNKKYFDSIDKSICSANDSINRSNFSHCSLYLATPSSIIRKKIVIIRCNKEDIKKYQSKLFKINNIKDSIYFISNDISNLVAGVSDKISRGEFTAYICENSVCSEPVDDIQKLCDLLSK